MAHGACEVAAGGAALPQAVGAGAGAYQRTQIITPDTADSRTKPRETQTSSSHSARAGRSAEGGERLERLSRPATAPHADARQRAIQKVTPAPRYGRYFAEVSKVGDRIGRPRGGLACNFISSLHRACYAWPWRFPAPAARAPTRCASLVAAWRGGSSSSSASGIAADATIGSTRGPDNRTGNECSCRSDPEARPCIWVLAVPLNPPLSVLLPYRLLIAALGKRAIRMSGVGRWLRASRSGPP